MIYQVKISVAAKKIAVMVVCSAIPSHRHDRNSKMEPAREKLEVVIIMFDF